MHPLVNHLLLNFYIFWYFPVNISLIWLLQDVGSNKLIFWSVVFVISEFDCNDSFLMYPPLYQTQAVHPSCSFVFLMISIISWKHFQLKWQRSENLYLVNSNYKHSSVRCCVADTSLIARRLMSVACCVCSRHRGSRHKQFHIWNILWFHHAQHSSHEASSS